MQVAVRTPTVNDKHLKMTIEPLNVNISGLLQRCTVRLNMITGTTVYQHLKHRGGFTV